MRLSFYLDDDSASRTVVRELKRLGFNVRTPDEAGRRGVPDEQHLEFSAMEGHALVTGNQADFVRLHWEWIESGRHHAGIIIARQTMGLGQLVQLLARLGELVDAEQMRDNLEFLSAWRLR